MDLKTENTILTITLSIVVIALAILVFGGYVHAAPTPRPTPAYKAVRVIAFSDGRCEWDSGDDDTYSQTALDLCDVLRVQIQQPAVGMIGRGPQPGATPVIPMRTAPCPPPLMTTCHNHKGQPYPCCQSGTLERAGGCTCVPVAGPERWPIKQAWDKRWRKVTK